MGSDINIKGENKKKIDEIETPEPPQRMYPLEDPFEEQKEPSKKHGIKPETKERM
ncbi:hypothetical protein MYP_184 [Sporocytophaga myxococcoides]|uniref:Uncharacterized protein n=1 Tax=Sporocytophaga myxococcoides TaxID=153721 RepID=A0A098L9V3_9BACT|nr:hypothetical protein [Sporocytophaga myxococcoides]GAL82958.1 hypothetical protein MYP_184 [Sporocytophaga myxococcoides]